MLVIIVIAVRIISPFVIDTVTGILVFAIVRVIVFVSAIILCFS